MGTVIPIDFKQRRRMQASPDHAATAGIQGQDMAIAAWVACLACLHAPLLMLWSTWLPSEGSLPARRGKAAEEM